MYNGQGDRVSQTVNGATTHYSLDLNGGLTQVLQDDSHTYLYGNGRVAQEGAAGLDYFLGDALGSVRQLVPDGEQTEVALVRSYAPYGEVLESAGAAHSDYAFTGEMLDAHTGLVFLRARYYSPAIQQFFQRDYLPAVLGIPATQNLYNYSHNNPIINVDPHGTSPIRRPFAIFSSQYNNNDIEDTVNVWTVAEMERIHTDLTSVATTLANVYNRELILRGKKDSCQY